ncbi:MAG: hypothetical protein AB7F89_22635, partial [Pirellulaceae bacterium]
MGAWVSRRRFLSHVGHGTLLATLGPALAMELGMVPPAFGEAVATPLSFGHLEPLVRELQETSVDKLQGALVRKWQQGVSLKTLIGAGALANARTFGGQDYVGFHTFMALAPALKMAELLPSNSAVLPVLKVLYRNTNRIQEFGGRDAEVLQQLPASSGVAGADAAALQRAVRGRQVPEAENILAQLVAGDRLQAFNALLPLVEDNPEVHRTVLPFRAWDMQQIVGTEHALTLLRQSLRYCLQSEVYRRDNWDVHGRMLTGLLDEFRLVGKDVGTRTAEDSFVQKLSDELATCQPDEAARAAASALADGFAPAVIGEAMSLAACQLVLRDGGRQPQWESPGKPAGCVHGDSVGVHASDAANAWRNMASVTSGTSALSCVIIGAWQVARDRTSSPILLDQPLPTARHLQETTATNADVLLEQLDEAVRFNQQAHATASVQRYGELKHAPERVFGKLLQYAVSEDGALHAVTYFQTVRDDFASTRPSR